MSLSIDEAASNAIAKQIKSKPREPFENAYKAALKIAGAMYVQGFLVITSNPRQPFEHAWLEVGESIVDPNLPMMNKSAQTLLYFPAHRLSVKQLKAAIEEAKEDYPEDDPLPIYGNAPYEFYGDRMLGDQTYLEAHNSAVAKCEELANANADRN